VRKADHASADPAFRVFAKCDIEALFQRFLPDARCRITSPFAAKMNSTGVHFDSLQVFFISTQSIVTFGLENSRHTA
jgi:hypothetical protein